MIKQLQDLDPTGEVEVYGWAGAVHFLDLLPGYWDGYCSYFEPSKYFPEKMFVTDKLEKKILIREIDIEEFIFNIEGDLSKVIIDVNYPEELKKRCEGYAKETKEIIEKLDNEMFIEMLNKIKNGFKIVQHDKQIGKYHVMFWLDKSGKEELLNQGQCKIILKSRLSNFFEPIEENDTINWKLKLI